MNNTDLQNLILSIIDHHNSNIDDVSIHDIIYDLNNTMNLGLSFRRRGLHWYCEDVQREIESLIYTKQIIIWTSSVGTKIEITDRGKDTLSKYEKFDIEEEQ